MTDDSPVTRPVILAADDDAAVLGAVKQDLRARYGRDYLWVPETRSGSSGGRWTMSTKQGQGQANTRSPP